MQLAKIIGIVEWISGVLIIVLRFFRCTILDCKDFHRIFMAVARTLQYGIFHPKISAGFALTRLHITLDLKRGDHTIGR